MKKLLFLTLIACLAQPTLAKVYKCTKGKLVTYVGQPTQGCVLMSGDNAISTYTPSASSLSEQSDETESRLFDNRASKQETLRSKLAREQSALAAAQKALSDGRKIRLGNEKNYAKYQARIEQLQNAVDEKQKRVQSIQNELN